MADQRFFLAFAMTVALATGTQATACDESVDPSRIAVAGGSVTEILFALGAGSSVVAADRTSNYPAEALELPSVGYVRALSAEGVLSLEPTLLIGEDDMGPPEVVAQIESAGVPTVVIPEVHSAIGIIDKVHCIGQLVGREQAATELVNETLLPMMAAIERAAGDAGGDKPRGAVLLGLRDGAPLGAGLDTSGDGLLSMAAATNVFVGFSGWKPVSMEAMIQADPDFFVIPERGVNDAGGLDALLEHPALRLTKAAKNKRVVTMDGMMMLGFGPRTLGAANTLALSLYGESDEHASGD
ncbi:MAG: ABC transporter substrate-binding protein [Pseudomonadota bacterium]